MAEYIDKQKVTNRMGCCLASAKAKYKAAKDMFTKARFGDYISAIQAMIDVVECLEAENVQPVDRWISIKDRLPEPEKEVLIWYIYTWGAGFTSYRFGISRWHSNIKRWYEGCLPKGFEVLYWQPLPEPPKEDD